MAEPALGVGLRHRVHGCAVPQTSRGWPGQKRGRLLDGRYRPGGAQGVLGHLAWSERIRQVLARRAQ